MNLIAVSGGICKCDAGIKPCLLVVLPYRQNFIEGHPVSNVMALVNMATAGACKLKDMKLCVPVLPSPGPRLPSFRFKKRTCFTQRLHFKMCYRRCHQHNEHPPKKLQMPIKLALKNDYDACRPGLIISGPGA